MQQALSLINKNNNTIQGSSYQSNDHDYYTLTNVVASLNYRN